MAKAFNQGFDMQIECWPVISPGCSTVACMWNLPTEPYLVALMSTSTHTHTGTSRQKQNETYDCDLLLW